MQTNLDEGETIIKEGFANLIRGAESVGGFLWLTSKRLIFESHDFNIQTGITIIELTKIITVEKCWTKFLNVIPLFPNSICISCSDGKTFKIVCNKRKNWMSSIEKMKK